jgi:hypothetical protein
VVYYVLHDDLPILAIILYGKNEQADLSPEEKRGAHSIVAALKAELARRTNR